MKKYIYIVVLSFFATITGYAMEWQDSNTVQQKERDENQTVTIKFRNAETEQTFEIPSTWLKEFTVCRLMRTYSKPAEIIFPENSRITPDDFKILLSVFERLYQNGTTKPAPLKIVQVLHSLLVDELAVVLAAAEYLEISLLLEVFPNFFREKIVSGLKNAKKLIIDVDLFNPVMQQKIAERIKLEKFFDLYTVPFSTINGEASVACFSQCGKYLVTGVDETVTIYDVAQGTVLVSFNTGKPLRTLCLNPESTIVAVGAEEKTITLWNIGKGTRLKKIDCMHKPISLCFDSKGTTLAVGFDNDTINLLNGENGEFIQEEWHDSFGALRLVLFDENDVLVACSEQKYTTVGSESKYDTLVWNVTDNSKRKAFYNTDKGSLASCSRDSKRVAFCNKGHGDIHFVIRDSETGGVLKQLSAVNKTCCCFSPHGNVACFGGRCNDDGIIKVWDVASMYRAFNTLTLAQKLLLFALEQKYISVDDIAADVELQAIFASLDAAIKTSYANAYEGFVPKIKKSCSPLTMLTFNVALGAACATLYYYNFYSEYYTAIYSRLH